MEFRCSPYASEQCVLALFIEHVQRTLTLSCRRIQPQEKVARSLDALAQLSVSLKPRRCRCWPLCCPCHILTVLHPLSLSPQKQKEKTQEVLVAWIVRKPQQSNNRCTCAWEDLHWADPSTLEVLTLVPPASADDAGCWWCSPIVQTSRRPWGAHSYLSSSPSIGWDSSTSKRWSTRSLVAKRYSAEIMEQIMSKTDGVPLFVEELTKMVVESGLVTEVNGHYELTGPLPPLAIPATLQDSLMARLDRLGAAKRLLNWAPHRAESLTTIYFRPSRQSTPMRYSIPSSS